METITWLCTDLYEPPPGQVEQQQAGELHIRAQAEVARHRGQAPGHLAPVVASPRLHTRGQDYRTYLMLTNFNIIFLFYL